MPFFLLFFAFTWIQHGTRRVKKALKYRFEKGNINILLSLLGDTVYDLLCFVLFLITGQLREEMMITPE